MSKNEIEMTSLTKNEIKNYMNKKHLDERLVITPMLNPKEMFDPVSINVRLGNEFIVMKKQSFPFLDISNYRNLDLSIGRYQETIRIDFRKEFVFHPRQLIIGSTMEYVRIPQTLMCYVVGKSTWGRMGLIIATATKVDPGFRGCISLEIINEGEVPIELYPGVLIAQLVFHEVSSASQYSGKYKCPTGPQFPDFGKDDRDQQFWLPKCNS